MFVPQNFEAAGVEQRIDIGKTKIDQVTRHIDAVPSLAQKKKLPAGGVRNLNDQPAVGPQQLMRGVQIAGGIVQMFQHMKHRHGGATGGRERCPRKCRANRGNTGPAPGYVRCIERKIEAHDVLHAALGEHLKEQASAASHVEYQAGFFRFPQRSFDEVKMIPQYESPVNLLQPIGGIGVGYVPVFRGIVIVKLQTDAAADPAGSSGRCGIRRCEKFCWWFRRGGPLPKTVRAIRDCRKPGTGPAS